jgi:hypothetical protein
MIDLANEEDSDDHSSVFDEHQDDDRIYLICYYSERRLYFQGAASLESDFNNIFYEQLLFALFFSLHYDYILLDMNRDIYQGAI